MLTLSLPVMLSLVVEPLAGVVDTAFVERLGASQAAALGAATAILSSFLWLFNFLGVGTQTEVAHVVGGARHGEVREVASLATTLSVVFAVLSGLVVWAVLGPVVAWMSPEVAVQSAATSYLSVRLLGFPAGLVLLAAFGVLRGLQDMRTPMWIAGVMSLANVLLDAVLIFGWGPIPAFGIAGAAAATVVSQVAGAAAACIVVVRRVGWSWRFAPSRVGALFVVGRDMVLRTAALLFFMLLATRVALQMGAAAGAGHQAIRQIWMLLAFLLDAYAASTQSLVAYFRGAERIEVARRVAGVGVVWGLVTGFALSLGLWLAEPFVSALLVPPEARAIFAAGWPVFVISQPLSALSFVTDGIHWGTGDFSYLRNGMLAASVIGIWLLLGIDTSTPHLDTVWLVTLIWVGVRSGFGCVRVWPGIGRAPLARAR